MPHIVLHMLQARTGQCRGPHCLHTHTGAFCTISRGGPDSELILALQAAEACCRLPDSCTWQRELPTLQASLSANGWFPTERAATPRSCAHLVHQLQHGRLHRPDVDLELMPMYLKGDPTLPRALQTGDCTLLCCCSGLAWSSLSPHNVLTCSGSSRSCSCCSDWMGAYAEKVLKKMALSVLDMFLRICSSSFITAS